jgi:hypothetical protein
MMQDAVVSVVSAAPVTVAGSVTVPGSVTVYTLVYVSVVLPPVAVDAGCGEPASEPGGVARVPPQADAARVRARARSRRARIGVL